MRKRKRGKCRLRRFDLQLIRLGYWKGSVKKNKKKSFKPGRHFQNSCRKKKKALKKKDFSSTLLRRRPSQAEGEGGAIASTFHLVVQYLLSSGGTRGGGRKGKGFWRWKATSKTREVWCRKGTTLRGGDGYIQLGTVKSPPDVRHYGGG